MARMIPPVYSTNTPAGEKELFNKIVADPGTKGWVVLHSLDVRKHRTKIEGELDMVILVPSLGVLCIEVKGCDVSRKDGKWIYPYETSIEGPFKQASRAMHSLRDYVGQKEVSLANVLFFSAVVFTRVEFADESPEWHPWQYISRSKFIRQPISRSITEILQRAHAHFKSKWSSYVWYDEDKTRLSVEQMPRLLRLLRNDFDFPASVRVDVEQLERGIRQFTEEQFDALDLLDENPRVVFKGLAGTGKTLLALEAVRRTAITGKSALLICYNHLLGQWLIKQTSAWENCGNQIKCGTFHSLLLEIAQGKAPPLPNSEFWRKQLPIVVADRLLEDKRTWPVYDMVVIDEAQDLITDEYLDVIDLLLKGGLAGGRWAMFGDFARQAIYTSDNGQLASESLCGLAVRSPHHVNRTLSINCRNAVPVAELLTIASGLNPGYKRVLQDMEGADVNPKFYKSEVHQQTLLLDTLRDLTLNFKAEEIVVLSMRTNEGSCSAMVANRSTGVRLYPLRNETEQGAVAYASIHSFKGLESRVVVLTDIERLDDEKSQALLYVGVSRARVILYMLMNESCRASYNRLLDSGLEMSTRRN